MRSQLLNSIHDLKVTTAHATLRDVIVETCPHIVVNQADASYHFLTSAH